MFWEAGGRRTCRPVTGARRLLAPAAATRVSADASRPRSDDYFCSMLGALQLRAAQNNGSHALEESVLVLAPRFMEPRDGAQE